MAENKNFFKFAPILFSSRVQSRHKNASKAQQKYRADQLIWLSSFPRLHITPVL
jgi:hypothetical protein